MEKETKRMRMRGCKYDSEAGVFEGYASVFGNVDSDGDLVEPGAFAKFLAGDCSRVKILALHNDEWLPIGKPLELYEDDIGLYLKAKISDTAMGRDVLALLRDGVLNELSIGYITHDSYMDNQHIRHLTELELLEVSVVTWAANDQAKILDVKSRRKAKAAGSLPELADLLDQAAAIARALTDASGDAGKAHTLCAELKSIPGRAGKKRRTAGKK